MRFSKSSLFSTLAALMAGAAIPIIFVALY